MKSVRRIKFKHYSREILKYLLIAGMIMVAAQSPYFSLYLTRAIFKKKKIGNRSAINAFYYLKKNGSIMITRKGHDVCIRLTKEGKKKAGKYQIDDLKLERPKRWDGRWRIVIFDIPTTSNLIRDVFRGKLREFGFYQLQKSVWVHPFDCKEEINLLRDFLGIGKRRIQLLEVSKIDDDIFLRRHFNL